MAFEQAAIAVQDEPMFIRLHALIDLVFSSREIEVFLSGLIRARVSIRDLERVLEKGLLGKESAALYRALPVSDQALTRERYLRVVESVSAGLRERYFRVYASY